MSTRSLIAVEDMETGIVRSIYCHFDGYLEGVGKTLCEHWNDPLSVKELINLGDLSQLGQEIGEKHAFDYHQEFYDKHKRPDQTFGTDHEAMQADPEFQRLRARCLAYGRDRGETGVDPTSHANEDAYFEYGKESWAEYLYLYRQGVWLYAEPGGDAGPCIVRADDPNAEAELIWRHVEGMLEIGEKPRRYAFASA